MDFKIAIQFKRGMRDDLDRLREAARKARDASRSAAAGFDIFKFVAEARRQKVAAVRLVQFRAGLVDRDRERRAGAAVTPTPAADMATSLAELVRAFAPKVDGWERPSRPWKGQRGRADPVPLGVKTYTRRRFRQAGPPRNRSRSQPGGKTAARAARRRRTT